MTRDDIDLAALGLDPGRFFVDDSDCRPCPFVFRRDDGVAEYALWEGALVPAAEFRRPDRPGAAPVHGFAADVAGLSFAVEITPAEAGQS